MMDELQEGLGRGRSREPTSEEEALTGQGLVGSRLNSPGVSGSKAQQATICLISPPMNFLSTKRLMNLLGTFTVCDKAAMWQTGPDI